jgi:hypothetical protein
MRIGSAAVLLGLVLCAEPALARIGVEGPNGFMVTMLARIEPGTEFVQSGLVEAKTEGRLHRFILDSGQRRYFAYDFVMVASGTDRLRVRLEPLSMSAAAIAEVKFVDPSWTAVPLLTFPVVPEVRAGDNVVVDLLRNPTTGQRVVDNISFTRPGRAAFTLPARPARDFGLADVDLQVANPRIGINGALVEASAQFGGEISGGVLWFYLEGRGRFEVSVLPNAARGFRRAGEVAGGSLSFTMGPDRFSIHSTNRIAAGEGTFNIYVRHDPAWRPGGVEATVPILLGAED